MSDYRMSHAALFVGAIVVVSSVYGTLGALLEPGSISLFLASSHDWSMRFDRDLFTVMFGTLFAIMNPLAAIPLFLSSTEGNSRRARSRFAALAAVTVFVAAVVVALCGRHMLSAFSLSTDSMRIAGGIIVLMMGIQLLQSDGPGEQSSASRHDGDDVGRSKMICPLAIPFLIGPGAITTIVVHTESVVSVAELTAIAAVIVSLSLVVFATLRAAVPLSRVLGDVGLVVLTRIGGTIVAAVAIDMMVTGVRSAFPAIG